MEKYDDDKYTKNLYKWKKDNSKLNSKIKESENYQSVHQWLRKVEGASEAAINTALKPQSSRKNDQNSTTPQTTLDPYSEAHDLINQWITDKIRLDMDDDFYNYVNVEEMNKFTENEKFLDQVKAELMKDDDSDDILDIKGVDYDKYEEGYIAKDILDKILKKDLVNKQKLMSNQEKKAKVVDMQMKIEMRHQAVKENREKRVKELELKRREKLERKEIELKARQMVMKEEQDKKMKEEMERQLIEQEANRLRIEMIQQRQRDEDLRKKQREMNMIIMERERQEMANLQKKMEINNLESALDTKRNEIAEKRAEELVNTYLKNKQMRTLQKMFSSWYTLVLDLRIKTGKAKALADWKLSYKVFNGWKRLSVTEKVKKEQAIHTDLIKIENIKNAKASNHYNLKLKQRYLVEWLKFHKSAQLAKQIELEKQKTKSKMEQFLVAVTESKADTSIQDVSQYYDNQPSTTRSVKTGRSTVRSNPLHRSRSFENEVPISDRKKVTKIVSSRPSSRNVNLNQSKILPVEDQKPTNINIDKKVKDMIYPWVKSPYTASTNNYDNRFKAQDKLLQEQQKMIKEQQRLIEELKFQQNQALFKEQIALLEDIKAKQLDLEKMQRAQYQQEKKLLRQKALLKGKKVEETGDIKKDDASGSEKTISDAEELLNLEEGQNKSNETSRSKSSGRNEASSRVESSSRATIVPPAPQNKFVKDMEERARVREQLKREREEKRKKAELERLELLKAQQEEKLKIEEEERKKKAEELREKRRAQQLIEEKRKQELNKQNESVNKADDFYKKYLMRHYGMTGLKLLIKARNEKMQLAEQKYRKTIFTKLFYPWRYSVRSELSVKERIADDFYGKFLFRNYFQNGIKVFKQHAQIEMAKAGRFYRFNIKLKLFRTWLTYTVAEKKKYLKYDDIVREHNLSRVRKTYFTIWRQYPAEKKRTQEREKRLADLRSKVREIIPDYDPV